MNTDRLTNTAQTHLNYKNWPLTISYLECGQRAFGMGGRKVLGKCCATYHYAARIYRCIETCFDAMHFRTIPEKSGNSHLAGHRNFYSVAVIGLLHFKFG